MLFIKPFKKSNMIEFALTYIIMMSIFGGAILIVGIKEIITNQKFINKYGKPIQKIGKQ